RWNIQSENLCESRIGENQPFSTVYDSHAFDHAAENCRRHVALSGKRAYRAVEPSGGLIQRGAKRLQRVSRAIDRQRTEIALRHPAGEFLEALDTARKTARYQQSRAAGHKQNHKRAQPEPPPKRSQHFVRSFGGQRESQDNRWLSTSDLVSNGVIE